MEPADDGDLSLNLSEQSSYLQDDHDLHVGRDSSEPISPLDGGGDLGKGFKEDIDAIEIAAESKQDSNGVDVAQEKEEEKEKENEENEEREEEENRKENEGDKGLDEETKDGECIHPWRFTICRSPGIMRY